MTSPNVSARTSGGTDDAVSDWLASNWRSLAIGAAVIAAGAGGYWLWGRQVALKEERAERAFASASQLAGSGNEDQARTELQKMAERYAGTNAGGLGAMVLAQQLYEQDKAAEAVPMLEKALGSAPAHLRPSMQALIAAGLSAQGKEAEAADRYRRAADLVRGIERDTYLADAARSLGAAGKSAEALAIWKELAEREGSPRAVEARIRVGELSATVQPQ